jgi:hypothetical protein
MVSVDPAVIIVHQWKKDKERDLESRCERARDGKKV